MQEVYQNVHPKTTMMMQQGKMISGVVSYDHFKNVDLMLRHYPGPGDSLVWRQSFRNSVWRRNYAVIYF
jgi:hypothetical protein